MIYHNFFKQFLVRWLVALMLAPGIVQAQAVPSSLAQRAISGIVQSKMASRGFASNDPRWGATLQSSGSSIAGAAAAAAVVTAAGVTAPAWVTAGAVIALGALFSAGINLAVDGVKWLFNSDGSVTTSGTVAAASQKGPNTFSARGGLWKTGNAMAMAALWASDYMQASTPGAITVGIDWCTNESWGSICSFSFTNRVGTTHDRMNFYMEPVPYNCDGNTLNGVCQPPATSSSNTTGSPTQAASWLTDADKAKPANPDILAAIADQAWKQASQQPGYTGYPYDAANPITAADAAAWQAANRQVWPTVGDIVAPQPTSSGSSSPFSLPNFAADPAPSTGTDKPPAQTGTTFDWSIPNTGESIPKQTVPVSYVPTVFAAPTGCPAPVTFTMFGKQYAIAYSPFCDLMTTLAPIFLACGAAAAALIFAESLKS